VSKAAIAVIPREAGDFTKLEALLDPYSIQGIDRGRYSPAKVA
jgi:hypothetical protein